MRYVLGLLLACLLAVASAAGQTGTSVVNSPHNLSAAGPGTIRAASEPEVCVFCHAPHGATPVQPLWNRTLPASAYKPYTSSSLKSRPGQPTGSSKLCLSCHDGTIALGSVTSRSQQVAMAGGITTLPPGKTNLGTDLSDDHPISFRYDATLAQRNPKLAMPALLPTAIKLDKNGEVQCTSCHDPHNNFYGKFLVMSNTGSALCKGCHANQGRTDIVAHQACDGCHQPHTAPSGPYLLVRPNVKDSCLTCHSGAGGVNQGPNIAAVLGGIDRHDTDSPVDQVGHVPGNVTCNDCHEGHTIRNVPGTVPTVSPMLGTIDGVTIGGAKTTPAVYEYEVCLKCHGDGTTGTPYITRQLVQANTRLEFNAAAVSYHPVAVVGVNRDVPSLKSPYTINSIIGCTDCHGSDVSKRSGGAGPNGPHGSNHRPLLLWAYNTTDRVPEGVNVYALCYRCHERTTLMMASGPFPLHKLHVQDQQAPCSACHTGHGIAGGQGTATNNFGLINFDTTIVQKDSVRRIIQYNHTGSRAGSCTLNCHGKNHSGLRYSGG